MELSNKTNTKIETLLANEKFFEFIYEYEDAWLQNASATEKILAFFGDAKKAEILFNKWIEKEEITLLD